MPSHIALTYTADVDWTAPAQADEMGEYEEFGVEAADVVRGGAVRYPNGAGTTVRVSGGRGGDPGRRSWHGTTCSSPSIRRLS